MSPALSPDLPKFSNLSATSARTLAELVKRLVVAPLAPDLIENDLEELQLSLNTFRNLLICFFTPGITEIPSEIIKIQFLASAARKVAPVVKAFVGIVNGCLTELGGISNLEIYLASRPNAEKDDGEDPRYSNPKAEALAAEKGREPDQTRRFPNDGSGLASPEERRRVFYQKYPNTAKIVGYKEPGLLTTHIPPEILFNRDNLALLPKSVRSLALLCAAILSSEKLAVPFTAPQLKRVMQAWKINRDVGCTIKDLANKTFVTVEEGTLGLRVVPERDSMLNFLVAIVESEEYRAIEQNLEEVTATGGNTGRKLKR